MSVCVQREANTRIGCHVQDVYRERPPQKSGGIFRPHGGSANVGGVRRKKTWAGGVLERAVVQVRARQAEAGPLVHSDTEGCVSWEQAWTGPSPCSGWLRAACIQGEGSPGDTRGPEGSGRAMGRGGPLLQI